MPRYSIEIKEKARELRRKGYSVKEIAVRLGIAKSTSSLWVRNIKLNKKAQRRLKKRELLGYYKASLTWQRKRQEAQKRYRQTALKTINKIKKNTNHSKLYCALIYWCEGGKNSSQGIRFSNSDPALVALFLTLLRSAFQLDEKKFRLLMHLHEYHDEEKQKDFWSQVTKVPKVQFWKTFHKLHTKKRQRENYPGCIAVSYHDAKIARELRVLYRVFSREMRTRRRK